MDTLKKQSCRLRKPYFKETKEGEFGEILYIPVQGEKGIGIVQNISRDVLALLFDFVGF